MNLLCQNMKFYYNSRVLAMLAHPPESSSGQAATSSGQGILQILVFS